jgi:hypothetical protein
MDLSTPEIQRIALIVGAFAAIHYKDRKGVIAGGMIVPGFLVILLFLSPLWCLAVVLSAYAIYGFYSHFLKRIDYQRRTPMYILTFLSLVLTYPIALLYMKLGLLPTSVDSLSGTMIPAVIAFTFTRQGVATVGKAMAITTGVTAGLTGLILLFGHSLLAQDFNLLSHYYPPGESLHFQARVLQFMICLLLGYAIYRRTQMRAGGYMVAPIAAGLLLQPLSAVMFCGGCLFVYLVMRLLSHFSLIIGLKRYVIGLLYSVVYVWGMELLFIKLGLRQLPFQGNHLFVIIAMMSYANDCVLHRVQSVGGWMVALILAMLVCLVVTNTVAI